MAAAAAAARVRTPAPQPPPPAARGCGLLQLPLNTRHPCPAPWGSLLCSVGVSFTPLLFIPSRLWIINGQRPTATAPRRLHPQVRSPILQEQPRLPTPLGSFLYTAPFFTSLPLTDRLTALPLVGPLLEYAADQDAYDAYDKISALELFRCAGGRAAPARAGTGGGGGVERASAPSCLPRAARTDTGRSCPWDNS